MGQYENPTSIASKALTALAALSLGLAQAPPITAQALRQPNEAMVAGLMLKARQGSARDQYLVGLLYERGQGLPQDYAEAAQWYGKAAKQGLAKAQLSLGNLYDKGLGVPQSYEKAYRWYRQASAGGNAQAMYFVGSMLYNGDGVPADRTQAATWFQRSMNAGFAPAKAAYERVRGELQRALPARMTKPVPQSAAPAPIAPPSPRPQKLHTAPTAPGTGAETPPAGVYAVQVGSFPAQNLALESWNRMKRKLPADLANAKPAIYRKVLKDGRQVYRLNTGIFAQKAQARALCARLKVSHVDCLVVHY